MNMSIFSIKILLATDGFEEAELTGRMAARSISRMVGVSDRPDARGSLGSVLLRLPDPQRRTFRVA